MCSISSTEPRCSARPCADSTSSTFSSRSLLPVREELPMLWDLPLLQSCGKRVLMHFRGTDVRRRQAHIKREPHSYFLDGGRSVDERVIDDRVAICRMWCDRLLVSTPGLLDDVPDGEWISRRSSGRVVGRSLHRTGGPDRSSCAFEWGDQGVKSCGRGVQPARTGAPHHVSARSWSLSR